MSRMDYLLDTLRKWYPNSVISLTFSTRIDPDSQYFPRYEQYFISMEINEDPECEPVRVSKLFEDYNELRNFVCFMINKSHVYRNNPDEAERQTI